MPVFQSGALELAKLSKMRPGDAEGGLIDVYLFLWRTYRDAVLLTTNLDPAAFAYVRAEHDDFNSALQRVLENIESGGRLRNDSAKLTLAVIARTAIPLLRVYKNSEDPERLYKESMLALLFKP